MLYTSPINTRLLNGTTMLLQGLALLEWGGGDMIFILVILLLTHASDFMYFVYSLCVNINKKTWSQKMKKS